MLKEMEEYATVLPAVNQLELHPRFASPELRVYAAVRHGHIQFQHIHQMLVPR